MTSVIAKRAPSLIANRSFKAFNQHNSSISTAILVTQGGDLMDRNKDVTGSLERLSEKDLSLVQIIVEHLLQR